MALEHDAGYAAATRAELRRQGLDDIAEVIDAPLTDVTVGDATYRWCTVAPDVPKGVGLLLVDGPPQRIGTMARYPALPCLRARLAPGATIVVDDGDRRDERAMVERWRTELEGLDVRYLPHAKGTWQLSLPA